MGLVTGLLWIKSAPINFYKETGASRANLIISLYGLNFNIKQSLPVEHLVKWEGNVNTSRMGSSNRNIL